MPSIFTVKLRRTQPSVVFTKDGEVHLMLCADMESDIVSAEGNTTLVRLNHQGKRCLERYLTSRLRIKPPQATINKKQQERFARETDKLLDGILESDLWPSLAFRRLPSVKNASLLTIYDRPSPLEHEDDPSRPYAVGIYSDHMLTTLRFIWQGYRDSGWSTVIKPSIWFGQAESRKIYVDCNTTLLNGAGETKRGDCQHWALQKIVKGCLSSLTSVQREEMKAGGAAPASLRTNLQRRIEKLGDTSPSAQISEQSTDLEFEGYQIDCQTLDYSAKLLERYQDNPGAFDLMDISDTDNYMDVLESGSIVFTVGGEFIPVYLRELKESDVMVIRSEILSQACDDMYDVLSQPQFSELKLFNNPSKESFTILRAKAELNTVLRRSFIMPEYPMQSYEAETFEEEAPQPVGHSRERFPDGSPKVVMRIHHD